MKNVLSKRLTKMCHHMKLSYLTLNSCSFIYFTSSHRLHFSADGRELNMKCEGKVFRGMPDVEFHENQSKCICIMDVCY
jgi:hypothetical protein